MTKLSRPILTLPPKRCVENQVQPEKGDTPDTSAVEPPPEPTFAELFGDLIPPQSRSLQ